MKKFFLFAFIVFFTGCKSGKKDNPVTKPSDENSKSNNLPDSVNQPLSPSGKIDIESFGGIKLGQPYAETLKALGNPDTKSKAEEWGADGLMHEDWEWKDKGLLLNMASDKTNIEGSLGIFSIKATAPCTFKTKAGIGIGNTAGEVQEAYKRDINPEESNKDQITVGSVYGGIIFTIKNDRVSEIFLGAAAE